MDDHVRTLEMAAASYLGQGNVPCYRGPVLFDHQGGSKVQNMWSLWTAHYKKYRSILMADAVHVTRPGQNGGAIETSVHVDARSQHAFVNFFNPKPSAVSKRVQLPLYYAGLSPGARVALTWGGSLIDPATWPVPPSSSAIVVADFTLRLNVTVEAQAFLWLAIAPAKI